jgi:membrane protease YdiL (CAAX protease family)
MPFMSPHAAFWFVVISVWVCAALAGMVAAWIWAVGRLLAGHPLLPDAKPRAVPWGAGSVVAVIGVWLAANIVISVVYLRMTGALKAHRKPTFTEQITVVSLINGVLLIAIPAILRLTARARAADLGLEFRRPAQEAVAGTVAFLIVSPVVYLINALVVRVWEHEQHPLEKMVLAEPTAAIACLAFLSAVVLAPAAEELLFRGIVQNWLAQFFRRGSRWGLDSDEIDGTMPQTDADTAAGEGENASVPVAGTVTPLTLEEELFSGHWSGPILDPGRERTLQVTAGRPGGGPAGPDGWAPIVLTSALFAAVHLPQWPAPIAIFFLSVGLGLVYQRTGSLLASFLMHALFNGFSTLILFQAILSGHPGVPKVAPTATCIAIAVPEPSPHADPAATPISEAP